MFPLAVDEQVLTASSSPAKPATPPPVLRWMRHLSTRTTLPIGFRGLWALVGIFLFVFIYFFLFSFCAALSYGPVGYLLLPTYGQDSPEVGTSVVAAFVAAFVTLFLSLFYLLCIRNAEALVAVIPQSVE